jgi:drug/metabolite transporter (DMT)-like permease
MPTLRPGTGWPLLALGLNAFVWGVSWWPFRQLQALGLHPLWATVLIYLLAVGVLTLLRPQAWRELVRTPALWVLVLAAGTTNASFNWAVTIGDVVRVVLLFYLSPLWSVLLARALLGEPLSPRALLRVGLALAGAFVILLPAGGGWPLPRSGAEWLALIGGMSFALNNVMLRREARRSTAGRALAMFAGGAAVAGVLALGLGAQGLVAAPPAPALPWLAGVAALTVVFLAGNLALQFGAARLPAGLTAVVLVCEVPIAAASAAWLGAGTLSAGLLIGGLLVVGASLVPPRARAP